MRFRSIGVSASSMTVGVVNLMSCIFVEYFRLCIVSKCKYGDALSYFANIPPLLVRKKEKSFLVA